MIESTLKAVATILILASLASACSPTAAGQIERVQALEEKVNSIAAMETELAALRGEVAGLQSHLDEVSGKIAPVEPVGEPANPFEIVLVQYVLDTAGFHAMAETLTEAEQVDPAYLSTVNRVRKVLSATSWPDSLIEPGQAFLTQLDAFKAALEADNGEEAARLAELTHEAQHDLSHAIDGYLGVGENED